MFQILFFDYAKNSAKLFLQSVTGTEIVPVSAWQKSPSGLSTKFCSLLRAYRRYTRYNVPFLTSEKFHLHPDISSPHKARSRFMGFPFCLWRINSTLAAWEVCSTRYTPWRKMFFSLFSAYAENSAKLFSAVWNLRRRAEVFYSIWLDLTNYNFADTLTVSPGAFRTFIGGYENG